MKRKIMILRLIVIPVILLFAIFIIQNLGEQKARAAGTGPCDIYARGGTPCVAAHSTVRALYGEYNGPLYQVRRTSDNATRDIPVLTAGGFVDISVQDQFCAGATCTISIIYDQTPNHNDLPKSPPAIWLPNGGNEANAAQGQITISGHTAHGIYVTGYSTDIGYRATNTRGIATGDQPESMYMVVDGRRYSDQCCFDYGNATPTGGADGNGTMEAVYFGNDITWGGRGEGNGPWVAADLEFGVYKSDQGGWQSQDVYTPSAKSIIADFAMVMLKGPSGNHFTLKAGNAQSGTLTTMWDGPRPSPGYSPKKLEGAIILGTGGDGSNGGTGTFFEGAMTAGVPSDEIDAEVHANIIAAGYGSTASVGPTDVPTPGPTPNQEPIFSGGPYNPDGTGGYDLPDGLTNNLGDFSIACRVNLNSLDTWSRIFDFGGDTNVFMMLTPASGNTGYPYFCLTLSGNPGEQGLDGTSVLPTGSWQHFAITKSGNTGILYLNGQEIDRNTSMSLNPSDLGNTTNNYIGRSQWPNDPYLNGEVDDFYVYNRALSASEVAALVNPDVPTDEPTVTPTPSPTTTPGDCNVFFDPAQSTQGLNSTFQIDVVVDSGNQELAAYGFTITYNADVLSVTDIEAGAEGFLSAANTQNPGEIVASGFDTSGTGPGSNLQVLIITFNAISEGTSTLGLYVDRLIDGATNTIGDACGNDGSVEITDVMRGDTNGDNTIDIIDALLIAQYYVELNPEGFIPGNADTDCDGDIDIVDALLVAQYYVMLITQFC